MPFEEKPLRDVTEDDLHRMIGAGLEEHLTLEYKGDLYDENDRGRRELLLDICMFANAQGGLLLIGIPEERDQAGQPTGAPDRMAPLGVNVQNPEALLQSYDARVVSCVEERLPLESAPIAVAGGRHVLAVRVPNSASKPHCARYQGHVYFPSRRERSRYEMDVREIKELAMRTASQLEHSKLLLETTLRDITIRIAQSPVLLVGIMPVFFKDFLVDIRQPAIINAVAQFDVLNEAPQRVDPTYTFDGLERLTPGRNIVAALRRNGLATARVPVAAAAGPGDSLKFFPTAIDIHLRTFVLRAQALYAAANVSAPMVMKASLVSLNKVIPLGGGGPETVFPELECHYPVLQIDELGQPPEQVIRPLCDQVHQTFGRQGSPCFSPDGTWRDPRR